MNEKRYFLIFVIVVGMLLGIAALFSYVEDPGGAFTTGEDELSIAGILLSGHNVGNTENYDDREVQKNLIKNDQRQVDVIVLGSSRSMQIHNSTFKEQVSKGKFFFNQAVFGCSVEDYLAILELYSEKDRIPQMVIIGADPWILNANNQQSRWLSLRHEYEKCVSRICSMPILSEYTSDGIGCSDIRPDTSFYIRSDIRSYVNRYSSLISQPILIKSIERLFSKQNQTLFFQTDLEESDVNIESKDGSIFYSTDFRNRTVEQIDTIAGNEASAVPIYSVGGFTQIDKKSKFLFESTIHYLKSRNSTVILFLSPYHPQVYHAISTDPQYSNVIAAELYFREFALNENIIVIGSYDPNQMNLTSADFYDGFHPRRETVDKIFAAEAIG